MKRTVALCLAEALLCVGLLTVAMPGCSEDHTHTHEEDGLRAPVQPEPGLHTHEVDGGSRGGASEIKFDADPVLDPFLVAAPVVDGTTLPGGQSMMLVLEFSPSMPGLSSSDMVLFLQRTGLSVATASSWDTVLVGKQTRQETLSFATDSIEIASRRGAGQVGVNAKGIVVENGSDGFRLEVLRQDNPRLRVRRDMSGVATESMICALSQLSVFSWESDIWSVDRSDTKSLSVGIPTPSRRARSIDGRWHSISLAGTVVRRTWELNDGFYASVLADGASGAGESSSGSYELGENGSVVLTSDGPFIGVRRGTLDPDAHSGIMMLDGEEDYVGGAFWWKPVESKERYSPAGLWRIFGRVSPRTPRGKEDETEILVGSVEISADGTMKGRLGIEGMPPWVSIGGEIKLAGTPTGLFELEIPVSLQRAKAERGSDVVAPHDH